MKLTMRRLLTVAGLTAASFVAIATPPAGALQADPAGTANARHHDCNDLQVQTSHHRRHHHRHHHHDDDECGPPPTVPEVPFAALLPLTGAGITAVAFVVGRRRHRLGSMLGDAAS